MISSLTPSSSPMNPIPSNTNNNNRLIIGQSSSSSSHEHNRLKQHLNNNTNLSMDHPYHHHNSQHHRITDSQKFLVPSLPISSIRDGGSLGLGGAMRRMAKERQTETNTNNNAYHANGRLIQNLQGGSQQCNIRTNSQHQMSPIINPITNYHLSSSSTNQQRSSMPIPCSSPAVGSSAGNAAKAMSPAGSISNQPTAAAYPYNSQQHLNQGMSSTSSSAPTAAELAARMYSSYQQAAAQQQQLAQSQTHHPAAFFAAAAAAAAAAAHYPIFGASAAQTQTHQQYPTHQQQQNSQSGLINPYLENFHSTLLQHQQQQSQSQSHQFQENTKKLIMNRIPSSSSYYQQQQNHQSSNTTTTTSLHTAKLIESVSTSNEQRYQQHTHNHSRVNTNEKSVDHLKSSNWTNNNHHQQHQQPSINCYNNKLNRSAFTYKDKLHELQNHNPYNHSLFLAAGVGGGPNYQLTSNNVNQLDDENEDEEGQTVNYKSKISRNGYNTQQQKQSIQQPHHPHSSSSSSHYTVKPNPSLNTTNTPGTTPKVSFKPTPTSPKRILQTQNQLVTNSASNPQIYLPPLPVEQMPLLHAFKRGSPIQLATGGIKTVENLTREDFVQSVATMPETIKIVHCNVLAIHDLPKNNSSNIVTYKVVLNCIISEESQQQQNNNKRHIFVDVTPEQPFFILGRGWSSISPETTEKYLQLPCSQLKIGDICITLSRVANQSCLKSNTTIKVANNTNSVLQTSNKCSDSSNSNSSVITTTTLSKTSPIKSNSEFRNQNQNQIPSSSSPSSNIQQTIINPIIINTTNQTPKTNLNSSADNSNAEPPPKLVQIPRKRRWSAPEEQPIEIEIPSSTTAAEQLENKKSKSISPILTV